jgi:hypothetical protein
MTSFIIRTLKCILLNDKSKYDEFHELVAGIEDTKTAYKVLGVNAEAEKENTCWTYM